MTDKKPALDALKNTDLKLGMAFKTKKGTHCYLVGFVCGGDPLLRFDDAEEYSQSFQSLPLSYLTRIPHKDICEYFPQTALTTPPAPTVMGDDVRECNRSACGSEYSGRWWWNFSTKAWYCQRCAFKINEVGDKVCVSEDNLPFRSATQPPQATDARREEVTYLRERLRVEQARFESAVRLISKITLFMKPDKISTPDGKVYEYHPSDEIVRKSWDGLTSAIREAQDFHRTEALQSPAVPREALEEAIRIKIRAAKMVYEYETSNGRHGKYMKGKIMAFEDVIALLGGKDGVHD